MRKYSLFFKYLKFYKKGIAKYFGCVLLSVIFSVFSIALLFPFLEIIFNNDNAVMAKPVAIGLSSASLLETLKYQVSNIIAVHGKMYALSFVCIFIIVTILLKNLFLYLSFYVMSPIRNGIVLRLRKDLYSKIIKLPIGYFTEQKKGDLMSRMTNDIGELEFGIAVVLSSLIKEPLNIIFFLATLFFLSVKLSLILLVLLPISGFLIGRLSRSLKKHGGVAAQKSSDAMAIMDETLGGMRVIKAFNAEGMVRNKFNKANDELFHVRNKMNFRRDLASPASEFMGIIVLCIILWIGGYLIIENKGVGLNGAAFIMYIGVFAQIINPAKSVSDAFSTLQRGTAAISRVEEILLAPISIDDNDDGKILTEFKESIEFKNVSFSYDDVEILKDISFKIEKGKTVALVGSSGAGKSTLADLIPRFHDVSGGEILVDGVNLKDYSLKSIRNLISIVTQEPILFNDTIEANIKMGNQNATQAEIEEAAKTANAYQFITKKEQGFATNIGDRGSKLSGGERQRMTIARALIKNPPILILDEATSSLDTESERLVQDAIDNMMQNRTSVVIAHRLSTVRHADEIIVLKKGHIIERGTHEVLMQNSDGLYKKLIELQEVK